jgi:hypothetical protein
MNGLISYYSMDAGEMQGSGQRLGDFAGRMEQMGWCLHVAVVALF